MHGQQNDHAHLDRDSIPCSELTWTMTALEAARAVALRSEVRAWWLRSMRLTARRAERAAFCFCHTGSCAQGKSLAHAWRRMLNRLLKLSACVHNLQA